MSVASAPVPAPTAERGPGRPANQRGGDPRCDRASPARAGRRTRTRGRAPPASARARTRRRGSPTVHRPVEQPVDREIGALVGEARRCRLVNLDAEAGGLAWLEVAV